jgi:N utilization substance protein A
MNEETLRLIDAISKQRKIDREILINDLEQAMVSAARRHFNSLDTEEFTCRMDPMTGQIHIWRYLEDGPVEVPLEDLGRIPAQTAKQVMIQRFREDERSSIFNEFVDKQGELVAGTARRYEGGSLIVQLDKDGRVEGFMPRSEQISGEQFHPSDRVRCYIIDVRDTGSQIKIVLSRAHPDFIRRLFEAEVPEVAEHTIEIRAMAREAGFRTKLAVTSNDSKVDPVGACVGVRGSRIRNIVDELGGEKIDIVRWNESSQVLIGNALKPAEVEDVALCFELGRATIIVREDQLSLAIGRRGQNVRLAARLTGWDIDILTPEEFAKGLEFIEETLRPMEGINEELLDRMGAMGIISVFDVEEVGRNVLIEELELPQQLADRVIDACVEKSKIVAEQQQEEKEAEEQRRAEEEATAEALLEGDSDAESAADSILGGGGDSEVPTVTEEAVEGTGEETEEETPAAQTETADEPENSEAAR